jgi:hypothetical protein
VKGLIKDNFKGIITKITIIIILKKLIPKCYFAQRKLLYYEYLSPEYSIAPSSRCLCSAFSMFQSTRLVASSSRLVRIFLKGCYVRSIPQASTTTRGRTRSGVQSTEYEVDIKPREYSSKLGLYICKGGAVR